MTALPSKADVRPRSCYVAEVPIATQWRLRMLCGWGLAVTHFRVRHCSKGQLLDHLVRERGEPVGNRQAERLGAFGVDHQLEFGGLPYRQVGRPGTVEDATDIGAGSAIGACEAVVITHEAAVHDVFSGRMNRRDRMASGERDELLSPTEEERIAAHD